MKNLIKNKNEESLLHNSRILIIEDDRSQRLLLRQIFEGLGFVNVEEAENGQEGWNKTQSYDPDLVILDMTMPVMDGFAYCKAARGHPEFKDITILVQTGLTDLHNKAAIFEVGATDYVTKPVDSKEVAARSLVHLNHSYNLRELKTFNERVKNELVAARNLIEVSLPDERSISKIKNRFNIEIAAEFESTQEMGGDFWGFEPINQNQLAVYAIDVSGHGIDSALSALRIHTLIHANADQFDKPGDILEWLNKKLVKLFPVGQFSTMFYGVIDIEKNELSYSVASTTAPLILSKEKAPPRVISGNGFPLGAFEDAKFVTESIEFGAEDTLVLYSDAVIEANCSAGEMFGEQRFNAMLEEIFYSNKGKSCDYILNEALKVLHKECGKKFDDDLTINLYRRVVSG